ncbi:MAG: ABC transporter permease [Firmicutes bacterium]|jgi:simple sugar transport system permease protein|nr:ABC transporter permease [Bacillota bacterium]
MLGEATAFFKNLGAARAIIVLFLLFLLVVAYVQGLPVTTLISNSLTRTGMNGILVLAMVPSIQAGLGLNFGLPVGIICGLMGLVLAMEWELGGFTALSVSLAIGCVLALGAGYLYGYMLNHVKGQEMMVGTYAGFSVVAGMCMFWVMAPLHNPKLIWVVGGSGLRVTTALNEAFSRVLDRFIMVKVMGVEVSVSLLGFFALACAAVALFGRTPRGVAMRVAGDNPAFATACGINVDAARMMGAILSTVLGAVGIVVYAQSFGFVQLYLAPLMMAFPAVAAVLIGGANTRRATVVHAVIGALLFQTLLTIALPVTQTVIQGDMSEVARMVISNGMILYALTRGRGES